jgi:NhaA family Na+:H+ antiporter
MKRSSDGPRLPLPTARIDELTRPFRRFLVVESASGVVLLACTALALVLANSPRADDFHHFWETPVVAGMGQPGGPFRLDADLHFWVNDVLMTLFFFVVGLEIKRELVAGELSTARKAALPVVAAAGGMIAPAGLYLALQWGQPGERGWGIPMATDIAFVVGVMAVFGRRVPFGLKVFLLALAIVDDIGAILVIAVGYSGSPDGTALALAGLGFLTIAGLNRLGVRSVGVYAVIGALIWLAVLRSGVHPTIAGVLLGLVAPSAAWVSPATLRQSLAEAHRHLSDGVEDEADYRAMKQVAFAARESASPLERLETALHPWVGFVVMPAFALANAGVAVRADAVADPVAVAVTLGLVVGKPAGIVGLSYLAVRFGLAQLPTGVTWRMLAAAGCLGGIGFTMALFVAELAFHDYPHHLDAAKIGILLGSLVSAVLGSGLLLLSLKADSPQRHGEHRGEPG